MKILIVAEWFSPSSEIAAVRSTKLYKYWKRAGHEVNVITLDRHFQNPGKDAGEIDDNDILRISANTWLDKYHAAHKSKGANKTKQKNGSPKSHALKNLIKRKILGYYFSKKLKKWQKNSKEVIMKIDCSYDVVFSTYGPMHALRIGERVKRKSPTVKLIVDFRDPPIHKYLYGNPFCFKTWIAKRLCKKADIITFVSNGVLRDLSLSKPLRNKAKIIPNGFDSEMLAGLSINLPHDKLAFANMGTIHAEDNFTHFFKVINELAREGKINKNRIALNYAGRNLQMLSDQAAKYGLKSIIVDHGLVSREESLQIQLNSHVMLFTTWNTKKRQGILKGKIFEQMMMNKPVLGLINGDVENSESKEIFDKTKIGFCYEYATDNYEELKAYILDLYNQWTSQGKIRYIRNQDEVDKYNYKNIAEKILEEIK